MSKAMAWHHSSPNIQPASDIREGKEEKLPQKKVTHTPYANYTNKPRCVSVSNAAWMTSEDPPCNFDFAHRVSKTSMCSSSHTYTHTHDTDLCPTYPDYLIQDMSRARMPL